MADRTVAPRGDYRPLPLGDDETIVTVLYRVASALPNHPALMTRGFGREQTIRTTYGQLLEHVERIAGALSLCGVRPGETVAMQIPNCGGSVTLLLACLRMGAVVVPVRQAIGEDELERVLAVTGASMCVVLDNYLGQRNAERLLAVSQRLPALRHRVVVGDANATGALDFDRLCRDRSGIWQTDEEQLGPLPYDIDGPCLIVPDFGEETVTTTNYRHRNLHDDALSSVPCAADADSSQVWITPGEVFGTSYPLTRHSGLVPALWQPILSAGTGVFIDEWDAAGCLDLFREAGVTSMVCPAEHWGDLVAEQRQRPRWLSGLRDAASRSTAVPAELAQDVQEVFGVPLRVLPD